MAFEDLFTFTRPNSAPYLDADGIVRTAAPNAPRFDHSSPGQGAGLLVQLGGALGQADHVRSIAGTWSAIATATVLHEWHDGAAIRNEAHYSTKPKPMVDGCLAATGHHRSIAVVPGYLRNYGGWVWAFGKKWALPQLVSAGGAAALATAAGSPLIGA